MRPFVLEGAFGGVQEILMCYLGLEVFCRVAISGEQP
jgi:hypothetical protein